MKILHLVPTYYPAYRGGGPIASVHAMNKALVRAGADVTVYTTDINGGGRLDMPLGAPISQGGVRTFYFSATFRPWEYSRDLHRILNDTARKFDIIHITSVFLSASTLGARAAKKNGKPYLISPRGSLMHEPLVKKNAFLKRAYLSLVEKKNLEHASVIHFTVPREEEEYIAAGFPLSRSVVVPNAVEIKESGKQIPRGWFRTRFGISEDVKLVLSLGRLTWKKGFDTLIPAFAEVLRREPAALLVIAGNDDEGYQKNIESMIVREGAQNRVRFTGMLLGDEKTAAFRDADVFVLPSYSENFGMAAVEAMSEGLPVVVTPKVGIAPYVSHANAGLVTEKSADAVAAGILKVFSSREHARLMGERGALLVRREFSPERIAQGMLSAYETIIREYR